MEFSMQIHSVFPEIVTKKVSSMLLDSRESCLEHQEWVHWRFFSLFIFHHVYEFNDRNLVDKGVNDHFYWKEEVILVQGANFWLIQLRI